VVVSSGFQWAKRIDPHAQQSRSLERSGDCAGLEPWRSAPHRNKKPACKRSWDGGVEEFKGIRVEDDRARKEQIRVARIGMIAEVDQELTPEPGASTGFAKFKAKRVQANLDMLKVRCARKK
jgi:hypothetical protein